MAMTIKIIAEAPSTFQPVVLYRYEKQRSWTILRVGDRHGDVMSAFRQGETLMGEEHIRSNNEKLKKRHCADCGEEWPNRPWLSRCPFCSGYLRKSRAKYRPPVPPGRAP